MAGITNPFSATGTAQTMCVHRSTDCGHTWSGPFEVTPATNPNGLLSSNGTPRDAADKEFADADPDTGRVLMSWSNFTSTAFAPGGAAQMFAYDVNGDGLNDVITTLNPHGYGLVWWEQVKKPGQISFQQHLIMNKEPRENKYGVKFSQPHAIELVDMDGDGLKDILTGKRFWAHGPTGDVEPDAPAVVFWLELRRGGPEGATFVPHLIDDDSGVGTQVAVADLNGDGRPDVIVANKKGIFIHLSQPKK